MISNLISCPGRRTLGQKTADDPIRLGPDDHRAFQRTVHGAGAGLVESEWNTRFRIQAYGVPPAAISSNQWADISDGEGAQWKVVRAARWASSANHIYGRNVTSSETWTWLHSPVFRATPLDMKAEADIHFLQGINQLIGHGWPTRRRRSSIPAGDFTRPASYTEKNPWWIVMPDLAKYLQRMSYLMRQGTPQNDVAFICRTPMHIHDSPPAKVHLIDVERELVGDKIMPAIFAAGYNLDFFDDEMLKTVGSVGKGQLVLGASKHRVVVLPGIERMPLESLRKLDAFVKTGGILIATRRKPSIGARVSRRQQKITSSNSPRSTTGSLAATNILSNSLRETKMSAPLYANCFSPM